MPILILTAKIDSKIKVDLLRVGAQDCIAKPFESEDLLARVRNLVSMGEAWRALQRAHREQNKNLNELIDDLRTLFNNGVGLETGLFRFDNKN
jgi:DNA-binding response OmpR family regulator